MVNRTFSFGDCFGKGWEIFKANVGIAILGAFVWFVIHLVGSMIPFISFVYMIVVAPPLMGGLSMFFLKLVDNNQPSVGDIFSGFQHFGEFMGVYWLFFLIGLLCAIPGGILILIGVLLAAAVDEAVVVAPFIAIGAIIALIATILVMLRWLFAYMIVADGWHEGSVITAFKKSAEITKGNRAQLFLAMLVLGLLAWLGILCFGIGFFVTFPIMMCVLTVIYRELKGPAEGSSAGTEEIVLSPPTKVDEPPPSS